MDFISLQELAGKQACEASSSGHAKFGGFDDESDWSVDDDDSASIVSSAYAEVRRSVATEMEGVTVSPLVRSIFEGRKKVILDAGQKGKEPLVKQVSQRDRAVEGLEKTTSLNKKVQALDEEIAIFKKESKRVKNLAKEHEEGLTKLAREKAEWEQQKKSQMLAFQAQQEEQIEKVRKEKQLLDHRAAALNILPAVQRKDVEELKEVIAKEHEEHRGKEIRLRLTINRLKGMNEDLTKQVLVLREEIQRYEGCVISALDDRGSCMHSPSFSKRPCGETNHKHLCTSPRQALSPRAIKGGSSKQGSIEGTCDDRTIDEVEHLRTEGKPNFFNEQAKILSTLFSQPWKISKSPKQDTQVNRLHMGPRLADWS